MTAEGSAQLRSERNGAGAAASPTVVARTERFGDESQSGGMLLDSPTADGSLKLSDASDGSGAAAHRDSIGQGDLSSMAILKP